jgi:excisionase family DNA binding protein
MRGRVLIAKYIANQRAYLDNHILPTFGKMKLSVIRPSHIEKWLRDLSQSGMSGSAINHCHSVMRTMLCEAKRMQLIPSNPFVDVRPMSYSASAQSKRLSRFSEAAEFLCVSKRTLYRLVSEKQVPHYRIGNRYLFNEQLLLTRLDTSANCIEAPSPRRN